MPKETSVTYELVAEVAEDMVAKGAKPSVDSIMAITGGRRDYVREQLKTWRDRKRKELEALLASTIDERLAKIILEDREAFTKERLTLLQEELDNLEEDCSSMVRGIAELHSERDELAGQLSTERKENEEKVKDLGQEIAVMDERLKEKYEQTSDLKSKLQHADDQVEKASTQIAELNKNLGHSTSEAAREKARAEDLKGQLKETSSELIQVKAELLASTIKAEHFSAEVTKLETKAKELQAKFEKESEDRFKALQEEIEALKTEQNRKTTSNKGPAKSSRARSNSSSSPA